VKEPYAIFLITESRSYTGLASIRPHPNFRDGDESLQEYLTRQGFKPGDVVELRIHHHTTIRAEATAKPGQLIKRKRRKT